MALREKPIIGKKLKGVSRPDRPVFPFGRDRCVSPAADPRHWPSSRSFHLPVSRNNPGECWPRRAMGFTPWL